MIETVERILQHRHCVNYGEAFVGERKFCSQACKDTVGNEVKGKLRKIGLIRVAIVAVTIMFVVLSLGADE